MQGQASVWPLVLLRVAASQNNANTFAVEAEF
jgi:hypothetical protein